jgi:hypothetical protein
VPAMKMARTATINFLLIKKVLLDVEKLDSQGRPPFARRRIGSARERPGTGTPCSRPFLQLHA